MKADGRSMALKSPRYWYFRAGTRPGRTFLSPDVCLFFSFAECQPDLAWMKKWSKTPFLAVPALRGDLSREDHRDLQPIPALAFDIEFIGDGRGKRVFSRLGHHVRIKRFPGPCLAGICQSPPPHRSALRAGYRFRPRPSPSERRKFHRPDRPCLETEYCWSPRSARWQDGGQSQKDARCHRVLEDPLPPKPPPYFRPPAVQVDLARHQASRCAHCLQTPKDIQQSGIRAVPCINPSVFPRQVAKGVSHFRHTSKRTVEQQRAVKGTSRRHWQNIMGVVSIGPARHTHPDPHILRFWSNLRMPRSTDHCRLPCRDKSCCPSHALPLAKKRMGRRQLGPPVRFLLRNPKAASGRKVAPGVPASGYGMDAVVMRDRVHRKIPADLLGKEPSGDSQD